MSELLSLALLFAHRSWDHRIMDGSIGMDWLHSWMAFFSIGSSTYHVENTSNEDFLLSYLPKTSQGNSCGIRKPVVQINHHHIIAS